ncbi:MAG: helix-hairpin-helix domain-containing protein [Syntrophales bacterium]|nr:helix-hairpin-helix domain-containing protein [Syntrophales bacterium]
MDGLLAVMLITGVIYLSSFFSTNRIAHQDVNLAHGDPRYGPVVVKLAGDFGQGGIYYIPDNTTLFDFLQIAGIKHREQFDRNMLALPITAGQTVTVDTGNRLVFGQMDTVLRLSLDLPLDLNRVTSDDLMLIPGIGDSTAAKIVQFRETSGPFKDVADLKKIPGIKEKKLNQWGRHFFLPP